MNKPYQPLVSIITPTFNHQKYIGECIESVISQTYLNWEMIIIDDGSTDKTHEIAKSYAQKEKRIKFHRQTNKGIFNLAETYNKALKLSSGEYIAILEGDDVWLPNKLKKQVQVFYNNEIILCYGQAINIISNKNMSFPIEPKIVNDKLTFNNSPIGSILNILLFYNCIPALTIMVKKDSIKKIGGFKQPFNLPLIDLPTLLELSLEGEFFYIQEPLGYWRSSINQITKIYPSEITEGIFKLTVNFYNTHKIKIESIINDFNYELITKHYRKKLVIDYSRSGRYKLIRKDFKNARKDYIKSIFNFGFYEPIWKLRSFVGIIFSLFSSDIESFTKFLGKRSYKK